MIIIVSPRKDRSFKFVIRGRSDSNYATDKDTRRSVTGTVVYLNKAPIVFGSRSVVGAGYDHVCVQSSHLDGTTSGATNIS